MHLDLRRFRCRPSVKSESVIAHQRGTASSAPGAAELQRIGIARTGSSERHAAEQVIAVDVGLHVERTGSSLRSSCDGPAFERALRLCPACCRSLNRGRRCRSACRRSAWRLRRSRPVAVAYWTGSFQAYATEVRHGCTVEQDSASITARKRRPHRFTRLERAVLVEVVPGYYVADDAQHRRSGHSASPSPPHKLR